MKPAHYDKSARVPHNTFMPSAAAGSGGPSSRILMLTDCYAPTVNGVVRSIMDLADGLRAAGHDVRVLTFGKGFGTSFDGRVYRLPSISAGAVYPHARLGQMIGRRVLRHVAEWAPDVVHSHTEFSAFVWARAIARSTGAAHAHTYHTLYADYTHYFCPSERVGRAVVRSCTRHVMNRPDRIIAPTGKVAQVLRDYGVGCGIDVIGTGVDLGRFRPDALSGAPLPNPTAADAARAELAAAVGLSPGVPTVLTVGRIAAEKNLAESLALLARLDVPWQWLVVGDGPDARNVRDHVGKLGFGGRVRMTGAVPADEVHRYYGLGDVFLTSSRSETQGLTCLEALASGVPVVCPDDEAFAGVVVDGVNGHRYRDADDFTAAMTALLSDANLRRTRSAAARAIAGELGRDRFVAEILASYGRARVDAAARHRGGFRRRRMAGIAMK